MSATTDENIRRLSLTIPIDLFNDLDAAKEEEHDSYVGIISQALSLWLERRKMQKMKEGYLAMNVINDAVMSEFSDIDDENW